MPRTSYAAVKSKSMIQGLLRGDGAKEGRSGRVIEAEESGTYGTEMDPGVYAERVEVEVADRKSGEAQWAGGLS